MTSQPQSFFLSSADPEKPTSPRRLFNPADAFIAAALIAIFACGVYFRFVGQNWDDFTHLHPDERFLTQVAEAINGPLILTDPDPQQRAEHMLRCRARYPETNGIGSFFDAECSNWYAKNVGHGLYVYGQLPMFVVRIVGEFTRSIYAQQAAATPETLDDDMAAASWANYNGIHLVGRTISAAAELLSLLMLFLVGRALYNKWVGLLAVAFGAAAVFPIQLSHFWTTDAFTNLPVLIAFFFAVRAMRSARFIDFVGFGLGMGAALASRINTLPLFGVIGLAAIMYALPALDRRLAGSERNRLIGRAIGGVAVALLATIIAFRFLNPHAFIGGPGLLGIFDMRPYQPFMADLAQAQYLTSGRADFPPNHQWASRQPYIFPARNIILWGMGVPLGLIAWFGFFWAGWQIVRARPGWARHVLVFAWVLVYFAYMGRQWVMTMRYFMPLYPFLMLLAAWALFELVTRARRWMARNPAAVRRLVYGGSVALLVFVVGFTYLWAAMYTSVYRRQLTRVEASQWVLRNLPAAFSTTITAADGREHLANMTVNSLGMGLNITVYEPGRRTITPLLPEKPGRTVDRVLVSRLLDPDRDGQPKTFWVGIALDRNATQLVVMGKVTANFGSENDPIGRGYTIVFDQALTLNPGIAQYLVTWSEARLAVVRDGDSPYEFVLGNELSEPIASVRLPDQAQFAPGQASTIFGLTPITATFTAPISGTLDRINIAHLLNPLNDGRQTVLEIALDHVGTNVELASGTLAVNAESTRAQPFGSPYIVKLNRAVQVQAGQVLRVQAYVKNGGVAQVTGTIIATEGPWDDPVPQKVCALPLEIELPAPSGLYDIIECSKRSVDPWGSLYRGLELYMSAEDDLQKQETMQQVLDQADYVTISSNRFYDTLSRIPTRFPMSIAYYRALFGGQLGYDLVKTFESSFAIGSLTIPDQNLPTHRSAEWVNEWESEEAFSVYDHPTVFIFKKNPETYDPAAVAQVLKSESLVDAAAVSFQMEDPTLVNVIRWGALQASAAPTAFMMTDIVREIQTQGGTWAELFNREWAINTQPIFTVAVWWLTVMLFGLIVWPILFKILPGLPDRAYPMAKIAGLLLVSWVAWVGGTARLLTWSQAGIALIMLGAAAISVFVAWRSRAELLAYVRQHMGYFFIVEMITLVLFMAFLFVRLGNPDLWAQVLGGEKPMNFSYFNAVLRSTVFPPYDPWYAGGFLNYYYYGYVLVGTPVKLLGIMPSIAYNLVVPTLFALTGIGAFSLAFNLTAARWVWPRAEGREGRTASLHERRLFALRTPKASPYLAGILAILLCVVLGNLDTPRVFLGGVGRAGGCSAELPDMYLWKLREFERTMGRSPTPSESTQLLDSSRNPGIGDQLGYTWHSLRRSVECFAEGIRQTIQNGVLPIGPERWYWGPRSVVGELPNNSNEINEFPFFTFVFGDLHAHMIALPLTLLVVGWLLAEVLIAGRAARPTWAVIAATALGGLSVGILRPTNTWDWITYLILGMVGLPFAMFLRRQRLTRHTLVPWLAQIGWFFAVQSLAQQPFMAFHATAYGSVKSFLGQKTPIWAYVQMHGQFLFVVITLLIWQTARLLSRLYVRDFVGRAWPLALILMASLGVAAAALFMGFFPVQVALVDMPIPLALVLLPLVLWCVALFLIPGQTREWRVIYAMIGLALALSLGVEIVVLDGDIGRQNTFFKFYMQVWMLLSVAAGVGLAWLFAASVRWEGWLRGPWRFTAVALLSIAALFPIMATQGRNAMRMAPEAPRTLNGLDYMEYATYYEGVTPIPLKDDYAMIRWLQDNVQGTPVILEAHQFPSEYKYNARITINTGLPTVLGWRFHQQQQRTLDPLPNLVVQREANITALYNTPDVFTAWRMLRFYHVEYIIVGKLEQLIYRPEGLAKFYSMVARGLLEVVYDQNGDRIYRVVPGVDLPEAVVGRLAAVK